LTLTLYLVGVSLGQLLYGPLSDRFGRKPLLLAGLALFLGGSALAALAPNAPVLILARVIQAVGGCSGLVLGRAMIRDVWPREQSASVMGYVSTAMAVAPMLAPLLGSLLATWFGWRATMLACLAFGLPLLLLVRRFLPETLRHPAALPGIGGLVGAYGQLLRLPAFRAYGLLLACSTGVFFSFAAGGPLVVVGHMGHSATTYAACFMLVSVGWSAGTFTTARLATRFGLFRLMALGIFVTTLGSAMAVLGQWLLPPGLVVVFLPMMVVAWGNGMTQPNAMAAAISVRPQLAGTASGLMGAGQMGFGALMTLVAGVLEAGSGIATALLMLGCALATQVALLVVRRLRG
jgi:DHA1 family bicyclomycin/chloramphenicol resistance-like MFS transporter